MSGSHPPTNDIEKGLTYENVFLHHSAQDISSDVFPICILHRLTHNKSPVIDPHESVSVAYAKRKQTRSQSRAPASNGVPLVLIRIVCYVRFYLSLVVLAFLLAPPWGDSAQGRSISAKGVDGGEGVGAKARQQPGNRHPGNSRRQQATAKQQPGNS